MSTPPIPPPSPRSNGYCLSDYAAMIADRPRMDAYVAALRQVVTEGCLVLDIGTGAGVAALVACQLGARKVIAQAERRYRGLDERTRKQRMYALLVRRGFDGDTIQQALKEGES